MRKITNIFTISEEVVSHNDFAPDPSEFPNGKFYFIFYQCDGGREWEAEMVFFK
jgi:hypothetical protein